MKNDLAKIKLTSANSIVIGSGILQALGIRKSHDIDLVVDDTSFNHLKQLGKFKIKNGFSGEEILYDDLFEIGKEWVVLNKTMKLNELSRESIVLDGVKYIDLNLLYKIKENWIKDGVGRDKDVKDLKLIDKYRSTSLKK